MDIATKRNEIACSWVHGTHNEAGFDKRYMLLQDFLNGEERYGSCHDTIAECVEVAAWILSDGNGWYPAGIIDLDTNEQIGIDFTVNVRTCGKNNLYLSPLYTYEETE